MSDPAMTGPTATSDVLAGTSWRLRRIDRVPVVTADAEPMLLTFGHDGRVSGSTGVNQLTASYNVTPEYLTFGPMATTRRAGSPELMAQEHKVVGSLAGMCRYRLTEVSLELEGPYGPVELERYGAPAPPVEGTDARGVDA
jgi:heat shock protein HslJ